METNVNDCREMLRKLVVC